MRITHTIGSNEQFPKLEVKVYKWSRQDFTFRFRSGDNEFEITGSFEAHQGQVESALFGLIGQWQDAVRKSAEFELEQERERAERALKAELELQQTESETQTS